MRRERRIFTCRVPFEQLFEVDGWDLARRPAFEHVAMVEHAHVEQVEEYGTCSDTSFVRSDTHGPEEPNGLVP